MHWNRLATYLGPAAVCLALGCAPSPPEPAEESQADEEPEPAPVWTVQVTGAGIGLILTEASGVPVLRIACVRNPAVMRIEVEDFEPVGSEERLSFGVDGEPFVFVADVSSDRPSGVEAEAPIDEDLLNRWLMPRQISAVYGAQTAGPYVPPDPEARELFVAACRAIAQEPDPPPGG